MPVVVDPEHYDVASSIFGHDLAGGIYRAHSRLAADLSDTGAMAGHDSNGRAWGQSYDTAVLGALTTISDMQHACVKLATMLQHTGFNHWLAESRSDSGRRYDVPDRGDYSHAAQILSTCGDAPSAAGGSGDYPGGWSLLRSSVGFEWPDGRPGALRHAGAAWARVGHALADLAPSIDAATANIRLQVSGEVADAVLVCTGTRSNLTALAAACHSIAKSCTELATSIDKAHHAAISAMKVLIVASSFTQTAGAVLACFTFGASEVVTQVVEANEIALIGAEVDGYLAIFASEAGTAVLAVASVDSEVLAIGRLVQPILDAELVTADVSAVPVGAATAAQTAEIAAETRLSVAAGIERVDITSSDLRGGHTVERHVGQTDEQLVARNIKLSGTFPDLATADRLTDANISRHQIEVDEWMRGKAPKLALSSPVGADAGRVFVQATGEFVTPTRIITVLLRDSAGYYVRTSYPGI